MMTDTMILETLQALLHLHGSGRQVDASALARRIGASPSQAARCLLHLERRGLVDASQARLTLPGLAAAVALGAHESTVRSVAA